MSDDPIRVGGPYPGDPGYYEPPATIAVKREDLERWMDRLSHKHEHMRVAEYPISGEWCKEIAESIESYLKGK